MGANFPLKGKTLASRKIMSWQFGMRAQVRTGTFMSQVRIPPYYSDCNPRIPGSRHFFQPRYSGMTMLGSPYFAEFHNFNKKFLLFWVRVF